MKYTIKKNVSMIVTGFMLAMFMTYGYVSFLTSFWASSSTIQYFVKLLIAITLLLIVFRQKRASMIGAGLTIALLFISIAMTNGRYLKNYLWSHAVGAVFVGLLFASLLRSPKDTKNLA